MKFMQIDSKDIILENIVTTRIIGDQIILTDGKFMISKNKNSKYITYVGNNNGPEKILLNIPEKGYYEISYNSTDGITYRNVAKPVREDNNN